VARIITYFVNAQGWVYTYGMNGTKKWTGDLYGRIETPDYENVGAIGFTGVKITDSSYCYHYIGFARHVRIEEYE
jgi:hypothetical protein